MKTKISYTVPDVLDSSDIDEIGGSAYVNYEGVLKIGGKIIAIPAWVFVGWVAPGANADIDGSGLQNWGDSQPGFWSVCGTDGQQSGAPKVDSRGDYDSPIRVGDEEVTPDLIPEWQSALDEIKRTENDEASDDGWPEMSFCEKLREQIAQQIDSAIDRAGIPSVDEPDAEDVFNEIDPLDDLEGIAVRVGDYKGCGWRIAWQDSNCCYHFGSETDDIRNADINIMGSIIKAAEESTQPRNWA